MCRLLRHGQGDAFALRRRAELRRMNPRRQKIAEKAAIEIVTTNRTVGQATEIILKAMDEGGRPENMEDADPKTPDTVT